MRASIKLARINNDMYEAEAKVAKQRPYHAHRPYHAQHPNPIRFTLYVLAGIFIATMAAHCFL